MRGQTLLVHSLGGSTLLHGMMSWLPSWKNDVKSKLDSVNRCVFTWRTISPNFTPNPIWKYGARALKEGRPNKNKKNKMSSDMRSVPDPKNWPCDLWVFIAQWQWSLFHTNTKCEVCTTFLSKVMIILCQELSALCSLVIPTVDVLAVQVLVICYFMAVSLPANMQCTHICVQE